MTTAMIFTIDCGSGRNSSRTLRTAVCLKAHWSHRIKVCAGRAGTICWYEVIVAFCREPPFLCFLFSLRSLLLASLKLSGVLRQLSFPGWAAVPAFRTARCYLRRSGSALNWWEGNGYGLQEGGVWWSSPTHHTILIHIWRGGPFFQEQLSVSINFALQHSK